jgi:surface polysaccharide O-acyltransferase-like enzyme
LFVVAGTLRFGAIPSRLLGNLADSAFGMYLFHYIFAVWLQFALLGVGLFAIAKAMIVFGGTLLLAWATTGAMRHVPLGSRLLGQGRSASTLTGHRTGESTIGAAMPTPPWR